MPLTFFIIGWLGGILLLGLIARVLAALFSKRSQQHITKHPTWHLIWVLIVISFIGFEIQFPKIEHRKWIKSQLVTIRQNVQASINQAGGWNVLRSETKGLEEKTESGNPFNWFFEKRQNPELTNSFPLISKLNPWDIGFSNSTNENYIFVKVYFTQWGGGRSCTRYYVVALTPTNHDELPSSFLASGDKVLKLTNSVYEITWQF